MKKYITVSLFVFWAIIVAVLVAGLISRNDNQILLEPDVNGTNQPDNITGVSPNTSPLVLSMTELVKHNSSQSCWLLISGKIYNVTTYLNQHPGNASTILPTCGKDATVAYDTKGRPNGSPHSNNAETLLANYFIGNLNQTLKTGTNPNTSTNTNPTTNKPTTPVVTPTPVPVTPAPTPNPTLALTMAELAKHNSRQSCWLLVSGKIYDVTTYLNQHPAGASTILQTCGTDATVAYSTRGGNGTHSSSANALLANFFIGNLNQTVTTSPNNPTTPPTSNPNPTTSNSRDDDDDDD
ncbi:MAG: cytochrome b5 domain-containing protein [Candidatus Paceibacterota bacterium]|jgi:cytochrome b involved in lipid metabolism